MSPDEIAAAISEHLDGIQSIVAWGVALAIGIAWPAMNDDQKIEIATLKMSRKQAFFTGFALYSLATLGILVLLIRLEALLIATDDAHFVAVYTSTATRGWLLNPFAFFGSSWPANFASWTGIGLLVLCWWACTASVMLLPKKSFTYAPGLVIGCFLFLGTSVLREVYAIYALFEQRLGTLAPELAAGIDETSIMRYVTAGVMAFLGFGGTGWLLQYQERQGAPLPAPTRVTS